LEGRREEEGGAFVIEGRRLKASEELIMDN
jgi:hypothetical protein